MLLLGFVLIVVSLRARGGALALTPFAALCSSLLIFLDISLIYLKSGFDLPLLARAPLFILIIALLISSLRGWLWLRRSGAPMRS